MGGAALPNERELPPELAELPRRQAVVLSDAAWEPSFKQLTAALEMDLGRAPSEVPLVQWIAAAAVVAGIMLLAYYFYFSRQRVPDVNTVGRSVSSQTPIGEQITTDSDAKKLIEAQKKGIQAITGALDGVTQQIEEAGKSAKPNPPPKN